MAEAVPSLAAEIAARLAPGGIALIANEKVAVSTTQEVVFEAFTRALASHGLVFTAVPLDFLPREPREASYLLRIELGPTPTGEQRVGA